jgi:uncharacterized protein YvpB
MRFRNYRENVFRELSQRSSLIPLVWSLHPTLDTSSVYEPYIQKYKLSCEIAAMRMVLQSFGMKKTEESLLRQIPHFRGPLTNGIWGDPDMEFV